MAGLLLVTDSSNSTFYFLQEKISFLEVQTVLTVLVLILGRDNRRDRYFLNSDTPVELRKYWNYWKEYLNFNKVPKVFRLLPCMDLEVNF